MNLTIINIGAPSPAPMRLPHGAAYWDQTESGYILTIALPSPSQKDVEKWQSERLELRARKSDSYVHLTFRAGEGQWDSRETLGGETLPSGVGYEPLERAEEGYGHTVCFCLVDSNTNLIVSFRIAAMSTQLSNYLVDSFDKTRNTSRESYTNQYRHAMTKPISYHANRATEFMVWPGNSTPN